LSWTSDHARAEQFASEAEAASRAGDRREALRLYRLAAGAESLAVAQIDAGKPRTLGILSVSAAALWLKADDLVAAEEASYRSLAIGGLPEFAKQQLREILQVAWNEVARARAGVAFVPGQVTVSVKGGEIVHGGAPLDLVVEKVQLIQSIYYRTAEFMRGLKYRVRGQPIDAVRQLCRPWLFQSVPGSYQFAVAVQEPKQLNLFGPDGPRAVDVGAQFLRILGASALDPESELPRLVPDADYRRAFLRLALNLAPSGKSFDQMEIRGAVTDRPLRLSPASRDLIRMTLKKESPSLQPGDSIESLQGTLRAVHLDKDWIEVTVDGVHHRIDGVGEALDDVIGAMVNRPVIVRVTRFGTRTTFKDIESVE
jgi:hypothetical protein